MSSASPTASDLVEADAAATRRLLDADCVPPHLGMRLDAVAAGTATVSLQPAPWMRNGVGIVHGGILFTLADTAFGHACNAAGPLHVGRSCEIVYHRPAHADKRLHAVATERERDDEGGIYDVLVFDEDERLVASVVARASRFTLH